MAETQPQTVVAAGRSNTVRWRYIVLALVLGTIAFLLMPGETLNSTGEVISGLSYPGRAVVAIAIFMATLWVCAALPVAVTALLPLVLFP
jgi:di/tricarboxylate transporter